jgi:hypothetical protein
MNALFRLSRLTLLFISFFSFKIAFAQQVTFKDTTAAKEFVATVMEKMGFVNPNCEYDFHQGYGVSSYTVRMKYDDGKKFEVGFVRYDSTLYLSRFIGKFEQLFKYWQEYVDSAAIAEEVLKSNHGKVKVVNEIDFYYPIALYKESLSNIWIVNFNRYPRSSSN